MINKTRIIILAVGFILSACNATNTENSQVVDKISNLDEIIIEAFENRQSNLQVQGQGVVNKLLADDEVGSRHQKFILRLSSGHTLLVAHNIDLAARIDVLQVNDVIEFYGEYEWNSQGGVIHWTHDDPSGKHTNGWLKLDGITYH